MHWDGGAKQKQGIGYGGYLGWTCSGECVGGSGRYYGSLAPTNNEAEAKAMVDCVQWALGVPELSEGGGIAFFGDSALCVAFMQKRYKAGKPELAKYVAACRKLLQ